MEQERPQSPMPLSVAQLQQELASLHKAITIINRLADELDIIQAMEGVRQTVTDLLLCEKVTLFLIFDRRQELRGITYGTMGEFVIRVKFGEGIAGTVAATGQLMNIADTYAHPLFNSTVDRSTGFRTHNMLCCAISDITGRNVAVLQALNKHAGETFTGADEKSLRLFGTHLGNTLAKAKLHEQAKRERNRLTALYTCFKAMAVSDGLDELLQLVRTALHDVLQAEHAFVFLLDAPRKELWCNFLVPGRPEGGSARVQLGHGLVGRAAEERLVRVLGAGTDADGSMAHSPRLRVPRCSSECNTATLGSSRTSSRASHSVSGAVASMGGAKASSAKLHSEAMHAYHSPPSALAPELIDAALMRQIAPALGDGPILSVLVQPLLAPDDKVMGAILVINKRETGNQQDIMYEDYFTEADVEAMALFALELGSTLGDRSLECALASALSVVGHDGTAKGKSVAPDSEARDGTDANHDLLLRSQLISMYFQPGPDHKRLGSESSGPLSPLMSMSSNSHRRWQRSLNKLISVQRLSLSQGRLIGDQGGTSRSDEQGHAGNSAPNTSRPHLWSTPGGAMLQERNTSASQPGTARVPSLSGRRSVQPGDLMSAASHHPADLRFYSRSHCDMSTPVGLLQGSSVQGHQNGNPGLSSRLNSLGLVPASLGREVPSTPTLHASSLPTPISPFLTRSSPAVHFGDELDDRVGDDDDDGFVDGVSCTSSVYHDSDAEVDTPRDGSETRRQFTRQLSELAASLMHHSTSLSSITLPTADSGSTHNLPSFSANLVPSPNQLQPNPNSSNSQVTIANSNNQPLHRLSNMGLAASFAPDHHVGSHHHHNGSHFVGLGQTGSRGSSITQARSTASINPTAIQEGANGDGEDANGATPKLSQGSGDTSVRLSVSSTLPMINLAQSHSGRYRVSSAGGALASFFDPADIHSWQYDLTHLDTGDLVKLCYDLFQLSGLVSQFSLSRKTLRAFLTAVASHHHAIPYHNFNHVCHVLHGVCLLVRTDMVRRSLPPEERLALLVAALCHDLDHDGCSNAFHVNSQSELARIYNDVSVLENHHCAMTFAILRRKDCALLDCLEPDVRRRLRKGIINAILSTDMSHHFAMTQEFRKHALVFDPESEADRLLLMKVLLHAADIGSAVRPFRVNDVLSKRVHHEFSALADKEVLAGLPVTFAVDPTNPRMCAQVECNFLDYVVSPLWERLGEVVPELQPCCQQLADNRRAYEVVRVQRTPSFSGGPAPGLGEMEA